MPVKQQHNWKRQKQSSFIELFAKKPFAIAHCVINRLKTKIDQISLRDLIDLGIGLAVIQNDSESC